MSRPRGYSCSYRLTSEAILRYRHRQLSTTKMSDCDSEDECFLPLPPRKANKTRFPPGCSVLLMNGCKSDAPSGKIKDVAELKESQEIPEVFFGNVLEVGIDLGDSGNRETVYRVQIKPVLPDQAATVRIVH